MSFLRAQDVISGQEGAAYATIDGRVERLFNIKSFSAKVEKKKNEVKTLGKRVTQHKTNGATCTGSIEYYTGHMSTIFTDLMQNYVDNGIDASFDITIVNDDPSSTIGKRTTVFYGVNLDATQIASLDVDSDELTDTTDFTFLRFEALDKFMEPASYGD